MCSETQYTHPIPTHMWIYQSKAKPAARVPCWRRDEQCGEISINHKEATSNVYPIRLIFPPKLGSGLPANTETCILSPCPMLSSSCPKRFGRPLSTLMKQVSNHKSRNLFWPTLVPQQAHLFTTFPSLLHHVMGLDGIISLLLLFFFAQFEKFLLFEWVAKSHTVLSRFAALLKCLFEWCFEGLVVGRAPHFPASAELGWTCVTHEAVS